jgi:hypothetical protein
MQFVNNYLFIDCMKANQNNNTTTMTIINIVFHALRVFMLLSFGLFSAIFIPAVAFLCGSKDAVGYTSGDPSDHRTAITAVVVWVVSLIVNLSLPYIKDRSSVIRDGIKPGTWHGEVRIR